MRTFAQKPKGNPQTSPIKPTMLGPAYSGESGDVRSIAHLQHTISNQGVQRLLQSTANERDSVSTGPISPRSGHNFGRISVRLPTTEDTPIQRMASISSPGDPLEREAGEPLDARTRRRFEGRLGVPLGDVRVHRGFEAETSAALLDAEAYTVGKHIVFGEGSYAPATRRGDRVLAHELTHAVEQRPGRRKVSELPVSREGDPAERSADHAVEAMIQGRRPSLRPSSIGPAIHRIPRKLSPAAKAQMKKVGGGELDDLLNLIVADDGKMHEYKRETRDGIEHIWEIMSFSSQRHLHSTFAGAMFPRDVTENNGQRIRHQKFFTLVLVNGNIEPETLFHELIHLRISIDKDLAPSERSSIHDEYAQTMEMTMDAALGAVTGMNELRAQLEVAVDDMRALFSGTVDPASTAKISAGELTNAAITERLINEKFAHQTAASGFGKTRSNESLAKLLAGSVESSFTEGVSSTRLKKWKEFRGSQASLDRRRAALEQAILAVFNSIDAQKAQIETFKSSGPPAPPANMPHPGAFESPFLDIDGKPVGPPKP